MRSPLLDMESMALLESNLHREFLNAPNSDSNHLSGTLKSNPNLSGKTEKPHLSLNLSKAKRAPLPQLPTLHQIKAQKSQNEKPEYISVPTIQELEEIKHKKLIKKKGIRENQPVNAPPIPPQPSHSSTIKRIDDLKKKLRSFGLNVNDLGGLKKRRAFPEPEKTLLNNFLSESIVQSKFQNPKDSFARTGEIKSHLNISNFSIAKSGGISLPDSLERPKKTNFYDFTCTLCDLKLTSMYILEHNEKIVELKCGHFVHEKCLTTELKLNNSFGSSKDNGDHNFSICTQCPGSIYTIPLDEAELDRLMSISLNLESPLFSESDSPNSPFFDKDASCLLSPTGDLSKHSSISLITVDVEKGQRISNRSSKKLNALNFQTQLIPVMNNTAITSESFVNSKRRSRGTTNSALFSIVSSIPEALFPDLKKKDLWTKNYSSDTLSKRVNEELANLFLNNVIKPLKNRNINLTLDILNSFGKLRLFDTLQVKKTFDNKLENDFIEHYCYLYTHVILTLRKDTLEFSIMTINYSTYTELLESGYLLVKSSKKNSICWILNGVKPEISKKWDISLKNNQIEFDVSLMTNTISEDEFEDKLPKKNSKN
ncbi:hypothetical protein DAMA08_009310 [Martiniozyma asiatica (nom. inval.)]|nr:hypothetical protein DAMA08_009310 [Martiniozyma asiatica]